MSETSDIRKNYNSIDLFKFIMAFAVVAIHTGLRDSVASDMGKTLVDRIINLGVPFFFLSSGYLLMAKMKEPYYGKESTTVLSRHLLKIVKLYFVWMTIYLPMTIFVYLRDRLPAKTSLYLIVKGYFLTGEQYNAWHFWYLLSTIFALIVIILALKIRVPAEGLLVLSVIGSLGEVMLLILTDYTGEVHGLFKIVKYFLSLNLINNRICYGLVFIPIGMFIYKHKIPLWADIILFMGGFVANMIVSGTAEYVYLLIFTSVGLFGIVERLRIPDRKIYPLFRKLSTYIYLIHMLMWTLFYMVFFGGEHYGFVTFMGTSILSLAAALIIVKIKEKRRAKIKK